MFNFFVNLLINDVNDAKSVQNLIVKNNHGANQNPRSQSKKGWSA